MTRPASSLDDGRTYYIGFNYPVGSKKRRWFLGRRRALSYEPTQVRLDVHEKPDNLGRDGQHDGNEAME